MAKDKLDKELEDETIATVLAEGVSLEEGKKSKKVEDAEEVDMKDSDEEDDIDKDEDDKDDVKEGKDHDDEDDEDDKDDVEEAYQDRDQPPVETKDKTEKAVPGKGVGKDKSSPYIAGEDPEKVMPGSRAGADPSKPYVSGTDATKVVPGAKLAKESVEKMFEGAKGLSADFVKRAETIFEAAFMDAVAEITTKIEEENAELYEAKLEEAKSELVESQDTFLNHVVESWIEENKVNLVPSIRAELAEDLLTDMIAVLESHNVTMPEDKVDLYEKAQEEIAELKESVNGLTDKIMKKDKELLEHSKADVLDDLSEGLAKTQVEKFKKLVEDVETSDLASFTEKATVIRESFFKKETKSSDPSTNLTEEVLVEGEEDNKVNPSVASYASFIKSTSRK